LGVATFQVGGSFFSIDAFMSESPTSFIYFLIAIVLFVSAFKIPNILFKSIKVDPGSPTADLEKKYFAPFIIRIVMFETCTLLGFILTVTTQKNLVLPFFILSVLGFLMNIPSRNKIRFELMRGSRRT